MSWEEFLCARLGSGPRGGGVVEGEAPRARNVECLRDSRNGTTGMKCGTAPKCPLFSLFLSLHKHKHGGNESASENELLDPEVFLSCQGPLKFPAVRVLS